MHRPKPEASVETAKKRGFSTFKLTEAYKHLGLKKVKPWNDEFQPVSPSPAFNQHLERLKSFDVDRSREGKKIFIEAVLLEAIQTSKRLKVWKSSTLESSIAHGSIDYLVAENQDYLEAPFICIIDVKKDDFEQGLAHCLMAMQACQWQNRQAGRKIDVFGIVTNSGTWQFYHLTILGEVYGTLPFAVGKLETVLGPLNYIFQQCEMNLSWFDPVVVASMVEEPLDCSEEFFGLDKIQVDYAYVG